MIERHEVDTIVESIARAVHPLLKRIEELEKRQPVINTIVEAPAVDTALIVAEVLRQIPKPDNGKDADPEFIRTEIGKAIGQLPPPLPGKDADPELVKTLVKEAVEALPKPEPGKDADPSVIRTMVEEAVAALPKAEKGEPGKDADPVDIDSIVNQVRESIPIPKDGKSIDVEEVRGMILGQVKDVFDAWPKPKDGEPGRPGKDADSIHPDTVRVMVLDEVQKAVAAIRLPKDGEKGDPGRDAIQIEVLPFIDPRRSYPRGTCAAYAGGTIYALRNTTPGDAINPDEWQVLLDGEASFDIVPSEDSRSLAIIRTTTSGSTLKREVPLPIPFEDGVYKTGRDYVRGAIVSYDGSGFICKVDKTSAVPGTSSDWRLFVKRGRDGKDLRPDDPKPDKGPIRLK